MPWIVGIDEAGYGPNLGPLVMTAVVAEAPDERPPDLWNDLSATVCRAGGDAQRLWVDDSKAIWHGPTAAARGHVRAVSLQIARLIRTGSPR